MANNFTSQPPAGRQLPSNWRATAPLRAEQANSDYQHKLENAWRGRGHETLIQAALLSNHQQPAPPAPPRRIDSRSDARFDAKMTLVSDNEDEQIWRDFNGSTVVIKKCK
jgi:hypothetical protein